MARHSHWHNIQLKKGAADQKRGQIFTKHARLIEMAARKGGDPHMNVTLRFAIDNARADNTPRENIDRAIKKGTGELKAEEFFEVTYEGYAPGGVALLIDVLTDNKNRAAQTIRTILQKHGGTMGGQGATSFMFEQKGVIEVKAKGSKDEDELALIEAGAEDLAEGEGGGFFIYMAPTALGEVRNVLQNAGFQVVSAELTRIPKNVVEVTDPVLVQKFFDLMEALENEDDVVNVAANFSEKTGS